MSDGRWQNPSVFTSAICHFTSGRLEPAAASFVAAHIRAYRLAVGAEAALSGHAPVSGLLIRIIKRPFRRIHHSIDVHALGAQTDAVQPDGDFGRSQRFHEVAPGSGGLDA